MKDIAFINCSYKKENSVTEFLFNLLIENRGNEFSKYYINDLLEKEEIFNNVFSSNKLVLGLPLFIDFIPAQAIELLQLFEKNKSKFNNNVKLYVVINSGYIDPYKNKLALDSLKIFAKKVNITWSGALAVGAGEMIKNNHENKAIPYKIKKDFYNNISTFGNCIWNTKDTEDIYISYKIRAKIFIILSKLHWVKFAKGNGLKKCEIYNTPFYNKDNGE